MYLVELRPGKEELYRTGDELAAAIRSGDVDMHSRIYHRATSKWISVTLHPQYKAIISERPSAPQLPPLERATWTFFNDSADCAGRRQRPGARVARRDERRQTIPIIRGGARSRSASPADCCILGLQLAAAGPAPAVGGAREAAGDVRRPACRPPRRAAPSGRRSRAVSLAANVGNQWSDVESTPADAPDERPAPAAEPRRSALPAASPRRRAPPAVLLKDGRAPGVPRPRVTATPTSPGEARP